MLTPCRSISLPDSVRDALQLLVRVPEVQKIIVFGSRAVGDHDERSDFDIAISAPTLTKDGLSKVRDVIAQSRTLYRISISLLERMPDRLQACVSLQGIAIYEREET
jgi:uncharacterized protein